MTGNAIASGTLAIGAVMFFVGISSKLKFTSSADDTALMVLGGLFALVGIGIFAFNTIAGKKQ